MSARAMTMSSSVSASCASFIASPPILRSSIVRAGYDSVARQEALTHRERYTGAGKKEQRLSVANKPVLFAVLFAAANRIVAGQGPGVSDNPRKWRPSGQWRHAADGPARLPR